MFIIPCKYNSKFPFVIQLVDDIRKFHPDEKIVVVDSSSDDKSYFTDLEKYNVIIEDIDNKHWMIGAYWHSYIKYPNEDFYYFLHDSMRIKDNIDYLKQYDLMLLATFTRLAGYNNWEYKVNTITKYKDYNINGNGVYGPIWFCKNWVMKKLQENDVHLLLPENKVDTCYAERAYGYFFEKEGFDLKKCNLYGDILQLESHGGKSGTYPHNTTWEYPIEKFYATHLDVKRCDNSMAHHNFAKK